MGRGQLVAVAGLVAAALSAGAPARGGGGAEVFVVSSLENVRARGTPRGATEARIEAARGEWEAFQLVVRAGRAPATVEVGVGALIGPGGATIAAPRVYRVGLVEVKIPSSIEGSAGQWADPLIPEVDGYFGERRKAFPVRVAAGEEVAAWIEVWVPRGAKPGSYRGEVAVSDGGKGIARVPIRLEVHRFELPATSTLPVTFGFSSGTAARGHYRRAPEGEEAIELARLYGIAALRHRVSLHGGTMEAPDLNDFSRYDREVGPFLDGKVDRGGPAEGAKWSAFDLRVPGKLDGAEREAYVRAMIDHLAQRGWLGRAFYFVADEPPEAKLSWVRGRAEQMARVAPGVPRLVTRALHPSLIGAIDLWCPTVNLVDDRPGNSREAGREAYGKLWWYQSCMSHGCDIVGGSYFTGWPSYAIDGPPVAQRVMEWLTYHYRVGGELYFDTVDAYRDGDPWKDVRRHGGNGDGTLFYPGRPEAIGGKTHVPVESIRLKRIRDGLEDWEYLKLLEARVGREAVEKIVGRVVERTWKWEHDPAKLLEARAEIARKLDEVSGP